MKKIFALILALVMVLSLAACTWTNTKTAVDNESTNTATKLPSGYGNVWVIDNDGVSDFQDDLGQCKFEFITETLVKITNDNHGWVRLYPLDKIYHIGITSMD